MRDLARLVALLLTLGLSCMAMAQNVGGLRSQPFDLPQTNGDREVLNRFFGGLSAVQAPCSESLLASLREENALAACAELGGSAQMMGDMLRTMAEMEFLDATSGFGEYDARWLTPWTQSDDFGIVRQLEFEGVTYYLTIDISSGIARVIRFQD